MRILIVSHPPLTADLGSAQTALTLAAALRDRGHDAIAWSPEPLPPGARWWNIWQWQARGVERFVAQHGPFDLIDTPAISASRRLARHGRIVVRSIQPELLYLLSDFRDPRVWRSLWTFAYVAVGVRRAAAILAGWRRASLILCLGTHELNWMHRRFPSWTPKLACYVSAPPPDERPALLAVRRQRQASPEGKGLRFLWMGRWAAHKGTKRLVDWIAERAAAAPCDTITLAGCGHAAEQDLQLDWLRSGRVRLVPSFSRAELPALLAAHDAGLFTSDIEGWGLSLNEMLESGMPVYATEAGGVTDLRPFFPGRLLPFPPAERPGPLPDLAANGYLERFSWPAIARSWEEQVRAVSEAAP